MFLNFVYFACERSIRITWIKHSFSYQCSFMNVRIFQINKLYNNILNSRYINQLVTRCFMSGNSVKIDGGTIGASVTTTGLSCVSHDKYVHRTWHFLACWRVRSSDREVLRVHHGRLVDEPHQHPVAREGVLLFRSLRPHQTTLGGARRGAPPNAVDDALQGPWRHQGERQGSCQQDAAVTQQELHQGRCRTPTNFIFINEIRTRIDTFGSSYIATCVLLVGILLSFNCFLEYYVKSSSDA